MERTLSKSELKDRYSVFIFDLDNTIYDEREYLSNGYKEIAKYVAEANKSGQLKEYYDYLIAEFDTRGRSMLFNKFIEHFNLTVSIHSLLQILRCQETQIQMYPKSKKILDMLVNANKYIYILTNGNVEQQRNKVKLLGLKEQYSSIDVVYASLFEPKPSPKALLNIINSVCAEKKDAIMIGDSEVDELTAYNANIAFINIKDIIL